MPSSHLRISRLPPARVACIADMSHSSPGHKQDADVLYGSQQSASPSTTGQLSGEGSHFDKAKNTTHSHPQADTASGIPRYASLPTLLQHA